MVEIGKLAGRKTVAVITDMDEPLGSAVGNALEVKEAIAVLRGEFAGDLLELCLTLGANIAVQGGAFATEAEARAALFASIDSGAALDKFAEFVEAQGGDKRAVYDVSILPDAPVKRAVLSKAGGYVSAIAADEIGRICLHLGGGRAAKDSVIDLGVGLLLKKKCGDAVAAGDVLAEIHSASLEKALEAEQMLLDCYTISEGAPPKADFIKGIIK